MRAMAPADQGTAARALLQRMFQAAIDAVEPARLVRSRLVSAPSLALRLGSKRTLALAGRKIWLVAAGKGAPAMALEAARLAGDRLAGGIVVVTTRRVSHLPRRIRSFVGGHPLPNRQSLAAGRAVWSLLGKAGPDDVVLVLLSGGASSLLVLPAPGIRLADKVHTTELLLKVNAPIREINAVRKHLSRLKGGGMLRRAGKARVVALLLSDVIGNSSSVIGSGPTAADATTYADALRVLARRRLLERVPARVRRRLELGAEGRMPETLKPGKRRAWNVVVGDNRRALEAAAHEARSLGFRSQILTTAMRGDTHAAARAFAAAVRSARSSAGAERKRSVAQTPPAALPPVCLLAGGETTLEVRGPGRGGRNQEFALVLAEEIRGLSAVHCLSAGSDGRDGPTDAAGAFVDGTTHTRARRLGLDPALFLERNDSYRFFRALGDLFCPGATGTNVMDLKIALVGEPPVFTEAPADQDSR